MLCRRIGKVLSAGKSYLEEDVSQQEFETLLRQAENFLRAWSPDDEAFPSAATAWRLLADAYRHACLLRVLRFPDQMALSCEHPSIVESVTAILHACAELQEHEMKFQKRLLFPLFMAGADTSSRLLQDYVGLRIAAIYASSGFEQEAVMTVLQKVWAERRVNSNGWNNVPWMEYVRTENG